MVTAVDPYADIVADRLAAKQREWERERASLTCAYEARLEVVSAELRTCADALAALRKSIDQAGVPIITVDMSGAIGEWNRKAADIFRCSAEDAKGTKFAEFVHRDNRSEFSGFQSVVLKAIGAASANDDHNAAPVFGRLCMRPRNDGEVVIVASPWWGPDSVADGAMYVGQDIRQRCGTEIQTDKLARLNATIIGVDRRGLVDRWNRKAELLTGYSREDALGKSFVRKFVSEESADSVQLMLSQAMNGMEISNYEFSLFTKTGQRREILWSAIAHRDRANHIVGVIGVGQDITELRSESKMLANYVRICGAAVWSLRGDATTGVVFDSKTKEIEHLISQQAQMDICDPRMVLWRASFVSILRTMCQNFWIGRKGGQSHEVIDRRPSGSAPVDSDFGYEFNFEAPNGSVKWYKVTGHLVQESARDGQFEVTGSMQEVTSMLIDKVIGDRWQKWWNRMCHMVFDATLLVDTQEYRVLNAWGEDRVFGCKLQAHHPLLSLIKAEDTVSLKEAFNEVTFKGFERGRTLHLLQKGGGRDLPAQCFLLSADQENPNECMIGIRMQQEVGARSESDALWDVSKPSPVLTLEDLARVKSGLKRSHRRPRPLNRTLPRGSRSDPRATSSRSLSSIPEDLHGEEDEINSGSEANDSMNGDTESVASSSKSSKSSNSSKSSDGSYSRAGVCNSSPSLTALASFRDALNTAASSRIGVDFGLSPKNNIQLPRPPPSRRRALQPRLGPPEVKLRWQRQTYDLNLDSVASLEELRVQIHGMTGVPPSRQTLILNGRRLPIFDGDKPADGNFWTEVKASVQPGQTLMLVGSKGSVCMGPGSSGGPDAATGPEDPPPR